MIPSTSKTYDKKSHDHAKVKYMRMQSLESEMILKSILDNAFIYIVSSVTTTS